MTTNNRCLVTFKKWWERFDDTTGDAYDIAGKAWEAAREHFLDSLTDEERVEAMAPYCVHCGVKDRGCQCNNDE